MTATASLTRPARSKTPARALPGLRRPRRPALAALSVLGIIAAGALGATAYAHTDHRVAVLVVARPVAQGASISASDLAVAKVLLAPSVGAIGAAEEPRVVGARAAVSLSPGELVVPTELTRAPALPQGDASVGVALKAGEVPSEGVVPGEHVIVVETPPPGAASATGDQANQSGPGVLVPDSVVLSIAPTNANGASQYQLQATIAVPESLAEVVSEAAAAGQVSLDGLGDAS